MFESRDVYEQNVVMSQEKQAVSSDKTSFKSIYIIFMLINLVLSIISFSCGASTILSIAIEVRFGIAVEVTLMIGIIIDLIIHLSGFYQKLPDLLRSSFFLMGITSVGILATFIAFIIIVAHVNVPVLNCQAAFALINCFSLIVLLVFFIRDYLQKRENNIYLGPPF